MTAPVLVIGATGRHGGTGTTVVKRLVADGHPVRALVHTDDERASRLRRLGATTVTGDLHDRASLVAAVRDVRAVYFTYPIGAGIVSAAANLSSALLAASPDAHLVVMSMAVSAVDSPSKLGQGQAVAEEVFGWAGLSPTVLRFGALFHQNLLLLHGATIREKGLSQQFRRRAGAVDRRRRRSRDCRGPSLGATTQVDQHQLSAPDRGDRPPRRGAPHRGRDGSACSLRADLGRTMAPEFRSRDRSGSDRSDQQGYGSTYFDRRGRAVSADRTARHTGSAGTSRNSRPRTRALGRLHPE